MKNIIKTFALLLLFNACDEPITIDSDSVEPVVIIEGLVTDQMTSHYVRVSRSVDFYDDVAVEPILDAQVSIRDDQGNLYSFDHNPGNNAEQRGYYYSDIEFAGQVGTTYSLTVTIGEEVYRASDRLQPIMAIDSLTVSLDEDEFDDPEDPGYYYEVLFFAREPQDRKDFYLFKFYRNDSILRDDEDDIYFSDDDLLAEEINGIPTAGYYSLGDQARVEMYSMSRQGFIYYNDLVNLLQGDGGMFGAPPVNPRTNLDNDALGFFQVSAVVSEEIAIEF